MDLESRITRDIEQDVPSRSTPSTPSRRAKVTMLADVSSRRMQMLSEELSVPMGAVAILGGRGGSGKSSFALHLGAQINAGTLRGALFGKRSVVLLVSHEDPLADVVKPRYVAAGGDPAMLAHLTVEAVEDETTGLRVPKLPLDADLIRDSIVATGARLVIFDPITSTLEGDNDKLHDVRAALDPLAQIAEQLDVGILALAHFRKGSTGAASDLVAGSHAYRDAARALLLFAVDRETGDHIVTLEKGNYSRGRGSWRFRLESTDVLTDDGDRTTVARVEFLGESTTTVSDVIANEAMPAYSENLTEILEHIRGAADVVSVQQLEEAFGEKVPPATMRKNLARLVERGEIQRVSRGHYASAKPVVAPPARSVTSATSATIPPEVAHVALVTPPHARESNCTACGMPIHPAALAGGFDTHPGCEASR